VSRPLRISGGLALPRDKPGLDRSIQTIPLPPELIFPLLAHGDRALQPRVAPGDAVRAGDWLADGSRASADGRVSAIETRAVLHPRLSEAPCVVLDTRSVLEPTTTVQSPGDPETPHPRRARRLGPDSPLATLLAAGIDGQGGAGFPAAGKLAAVQAHGCRLLLINACECEPGIACDEALLQDEAAAVVAAIERLRRALQPALTVIAIEHDKPRALAALRTALVACPAVTLLLFEPIYPSGAETPLLTRVLAHAGLPAVPTGSRPAELGLLCLNVATAQALGQALDGTRPGSRIVTLSGPDPALSLNARVTLGTPLRWLFERTGHPVDANRALRFGGPLSGHVRTACAHTLDAPITITTHAIALLPEAVDSSLPATRPCIRCGACAPVCPVNLQPQLLHWHAGAADQDALHRLGIDRCLECGCCDAVCPSAIPLTLQFRAARSLRRERARRHAEAERADTLIRERQARLQREALRDRSVDTGSPAPNASVSAALARVKARAKRP